MAKKKSRRVIEILRRHYRDQGGKWQWNGAWWECIGGALDGMEVHAYAQLTPRYDGDDETYMIIYSDQDGEEVPPLFAMRAFR